MLKELAEQHQPQVIATGGGIVMRDENRTILRNRGRVIYLSATAEQLFERTRRDKSRPLLQVEDRRAVIEQLVETRDPLYKQVADMVFPSGSTQPYKLAKKLAEALSAYVKLRPLTEPLKKPQYCRQLRCQLIISS